MQNENESLENSDLETNETGFSGEGAENPSQEIVDLTNENYDLKEENKKLKKQQRPAKRRDPRVWASGGAGTVLATLVAVAVSYLGGGGNPEAQKQQVVSTSAAEAPADTTPAEESAAPTPAEPAAPTVLVEAELSQPEFSKFATYKVATGDSNGLKELVDAVSGVEHKLHEQNGQSVSFSRASKPEQTVVKLVITDQSTTVEFRSPPTPEQLETARVQLAEAGYNLAEEPTGSGATTTWLVAK